MENRIHNLSMFIICISIAIGLTFIGCNDKLKSEQLSEESTEYKIDYLKYIRQNVQFDRRENVYELITSADYSFKTVYLEVDEFTDGNILPKLKEQRFNEAKIIFDNLIKFNK